MPDFDRKRWLDEHVVPLLHQEPTASIYTVFWNGAPPKEVLVFFLPTESAHWARLAKRLIDGGFRLDFLRDVQIVEVEGKRHALFGGDGSPLFDKSGVSLRLFKKMPDGINLILQLNAMHESALSAADAVKEFFGLFAGNPVEVCAQLSAPFGQA
jgi:hypothetical protein